MSAGDGPSFAEGLVGLTLDGRYRLDAVLGEGGMGSVFRAQHLAMDRRVAVKLLKPHLTSDEVALQRFAAEARRTLRVDSPHAVKVLDFGVTQGKDYYIVLEYLDGRTVQRELEVDGPFAPARVVHIARQALHALGAAHASGLVHRDIKPENILLMRTGEDPDYTKLLDFGVAKLMQGAAASTRSQLSLTQQGMVFGTPEFMSPEQACGLPLDARSDLYSLAATMFAMLTGTGLFEAATPIAWLTAHARTPPPRLADRDPALAPHAALDALLLRCLAKRPEQRPADTAVMAAELEAIADGREGEADAAASSSRKPWKPMFSQSLYIEALATADTAAIAAPADAYAATDAHAVAPRAGRRAPIALAAGIVIAGVAVAMGVLAFGGGSPRVGAPPAVAAVPAATALPAPGSAVAVDAGIAAVIVPADASAEAAAVARPRPPSAAPRPASEADKHVAAAEAAQRTGNRLRQMAEADAARRLEPTNAKATYLLADVLIATGDVDRGCDYLRAIKRFPPAAARARSAGCAD